METMEAKKQIRRSHLAERNALSQEIVQQLSAKISQNLRQYLAAQSDIKSHGVYGYYPHGNEVSLLEIFAWMLEQQIPLAFPRVSGNTMEFYQVTSMEEFSQGAFHIMEPVQTCRQVDFQQAYCLVPGSVFDEMGNRYGYGKGYYDRYFDIHKNLYRIGIAYEIQLEKEIPAEETDVKMQMLITENRRMFI